MTLGYNEGFSLRIYSTYTVERLQAIVNNLGIKEVLNDIRIDVRPSTNGKYNSRALLTIVSGTEHAKYQKDINTFIQAFKLNPEVSPIQVLIGFNIYALKNVKF